MIENIVQLRLLMTSTDEFFYIDIQWLWEIFYEKAYYYSSIWGSFSFFLFNHRHPMYYLLRIKMNSQETLFT